RAGSTVVEEVHAPRARHDHDQADAAMCVVASRTVDRILGRAQLSLVDVDAESIGAYVVEYLHASAGRIGLPSPVRHHRRALPVAEAPPPAFAATPVPQAIEPGQAFDVALPGGGLRQRVGEEACLVAARPESPRLLADVQPPGHVERTRRVPQVV